MLSESVYEPLKSSVLVCYSPLCIIDMRLVVFQRQMFGALSLKVKVLSVGVPYVENKPLLLREKIGICEFLPICGSLCQGWGLCLSLSYPSQYGHFLGAVKLTVRSFSE